MLHLTQRLSKNCATRLLFLRLTSFCDCHLRRLFLFVPNGLNETLRHWECGSSREARRAAEERGRERDPDAWGGWDCGSIILRSAYVCLCVTEHWRGSLMVCVCVCVCVCLCVYSCVYVLEEGREASGEKREMKRMSVPLRKCHTGKICRFWSWQINAKPQCKYLIWENFGSRLVS